MKVMLMMLVPLFDDNMAVKAYSIFSQKDNYFLNPMKLGTSRFDGAALVDRHHCVLCWALRCGVLDHQDQAVMTNETALLLRCEREGGILLWDYCGLSLPMKQKASAPGPA